MWQDTGLNGDAQRIEQLGWMLFLKIFSDKDKELELLDDTYTSPIPDKFQLNMTKSIYSIGLIKQMPKASKVYRTIAVCFSSATPSGSNHQTLICCYKPEIPSGLITQLITNP
jgi:hypothetical protein